MSRGSALLFGLVSIASVSAAQDLGLERTPARWRVTSEELGLEGGEDVALVGVHYELSELVEEAPELYLGAGVYLAVDGDRGGFHALGLDAGLAREVFPGWNVELGVFAGGAGGGGGPDAEGLLLRPHLAVERLLGLLALRAELARIDLPDDDRDDTHLAIGFTLPSELLVARRAPGGLRPFPPGALVERGLRVTPRLARLDPDAGSRRAGGGEYGRPIQMLGVGADYFLNPWFFLPVEVLGATGGGVGGFALALGGLGVAVPLGAGIALEAKGELGAGGGGGVDAGGGFVAAYSAGLRIPLPARLSLEVQAGRLRFPDGDLAADVITAGVSWTGRAAELALGYPRSDLARSGLSAEEAYGVGTRVAVLHKTYDPSSHAHERDGGELDKVHLIGVGVEVPLTTSLAATARAFSAYRGGVGGYGEGLLGLRWEARPFPDRRHVFSLHGEAGAAGGGGMDVGSGLLGALSAGYRVEVAPELALSFEVGRTDAESGSFEAGSYVIGLEWNAARAFLR